MPPLSAQPLTEKEKKVLLGWYQDRTLAQVPRFPALRKPVDFPGPGDGGCRPEIRVRDGPVRRSYTYHEL